MTTTHITPSPLSFNGVAVRDKGEMLSLTDMWKAAGSDPSRKPSEWLRLEGTARFIEFLAESQGHGVPEVGNAHFGLVHVSKGGTERGATYAHWQIVLAYAKYLSPQFHMQCNVIIRERMEGQRTGAISPTTVEQIERSFGIVRMLAHKVTAMEQKLDMSVSDGVTAGEVCDLAKVATSYPRGLSGRVSRRLGQFCARHGEKPRVSRLGRVRAQLFPTHLVREWLDIEGRSLIGSWIEEKRGQGSLRLISTSRRPRS